MYVFWWDKPLDVRFPIVLNCDPSALTECWVTKSGYKVLVPLNPVLWNTLDEPAGSSSSVSTLGDSREEGEERLRPQFSFEGGTRGPYHGDDDEEEGYLLQRVQTAQTATSCPRVKAVWISVCQCVSKVLGVSNRIIYRLLILGGLQDFSASTRSENESSDANVYDKVPTFYGYHEGESDSLAVQLGPLLGVVLASIFGAIHCIAWSSPRPTTLETQLWRILSLIVTFAPLLFVVAFVLISMPRSYSGLIPTSFGLFQGRFLTPIAVPVYIAARCMLLGLALAQLRELPPRAHETVEWSRFLPHIQ
ncbi:hypothetical protein CC2G_007796 [Coprinopsis cinerea AmutBmut pab1-1]|nr:hypothetical protein CC2G_007796 [Coprinopsis cinerea AmutBmut pab1-1]